MKNKPNIFISYSWQTKEISDKIALDLQLIGLSVIKDNKELNYTDSIPNFMKRIRECNYALLLISDGYLKSKNCLYEVLELQKEDNHWDKVLPIVKNGTKIYSAIERLEYIRFWEQKILELEKALEGISPINSTETYKELKLFKDIASSIDGFLVKITESLHYSPEKLQQDNYEPIVNKIGGDIEPKALTDLLKIALISNLEEREVELYEYSRKYPESGYYYSIKAGTSRDLLKFDQAIHYYEKGLKLDPDNYEILNNYGQVLEHVKKDYDKARVCYEKAIDANPNFDIPRLNLGVLLNRHYDDLNGAKKQYEEILKFDPNNAKAHNNMSNFYKLPNASKEELDKAEFHLLKAIEIKPDYIDALLGYGNFLKVYRKEMEKGNSYYEQIRELDKEGNLKEMLDILIKSNKG